MPCLALYVRRQVRSPSIGASRFRPGSQDVKRAFGIVKPHGAFSLSKNSPDKR
ncbi:hypothetical protein IG631_20249 [Alternaria alternata]|nr:hypothetical protein IG631_20249 [Alternaria alternata]